MMVSVATFMLIPQEDLTIPSKDNIIQIINN